MHRRYWLIALAITVVAIFCLVDSSGSLRIRIDPSTEALVDDKTVRTGNTSELLVVLRNQSHWHADSILEAGQLIESLGKMEGVVGVESAVTARLPYVTPEDIDVASLVDRIRLYPALSEKWIRWTFNDPLIDGRLVNSRLNDIGMRIRISRIASKSQKEILSNVLKTLESYDDSKEEINLFITGTPVVDRDISEIIAHDLGQILLLSMLIVPIALGIAFSSLSAVLLPLFVIILALLWSLSAMAILAIPINLVTAIIPPLVIGLTLAYAMHAVFGHIYHGGGAQEARSLVMPFIATGLTTIAGFLALYLQPVPAIRQFSIAGAISVASALLAIILILCLGSPRWLSGVRTRRWLEPLFNRLGESAVSVVNSQRRKVLFASVMLFAASVLASAYVVPGARFMSDLPNHHPTRVHFEAINESLGGGNGFRIVLDGGAQDAVLLPAVLEEAEALQNWLDRQPEVGNTTSLVDYIKRFSQIFQGGDVAAYAIPDDIFLSKQLLVIASSSEAERYTNLANSLLVIQVQTKLDETASLAELIARLEKRLASLPSNLETRIEGEAVTLVRTIEQLTTGQVKSLGLAIVAIYLVIAVLFSSFTMAFWAMLPNLLPIAVFYGLIGLAGIPLSPTMALVSCLVIGIAVDDTLFYLIRFSKSARSLADESQGAAQALRETLRPVTLTTFVLCLCFLTFVTGQFESQVTFGLLAASTLLIAWLSDLTLTPAIGARSSVVTLWDVLTVDLGSRPEETITLLRGMTTRQARLFALMTEVRSIPAGTEFITEGDEAQEMFVIIKGEARVWVRRDDIDIEIVCFSRGNIIGEMSAFVQHRTANVTALSDMQVLVFNPERLDRIRRRHPRIAALVYQNLNRIQAERLERTTRELEDLRAEILRRYNTA